MFELEEVTQVYVVPAGTISFEFIPPWLVGCIAVNVSPEHIVLESIAICGVGFTVIVNVSACPVHVVIEPLEIFPTLDAKTVVPSMSRTLNNKSSSFMLKLLHKPPALLLKIEPSK